MKGGVKYKQVIRFVSNYFSFFLLVAFVTTCCTMLFVRALSESLSLELNAENIGTAAKLTFINVALISLVFTVIDTVRRRITVDRPVERISEAAGKMIAGDFDVRVPKISRFGADDRFNEVIDSINMMAEELSSVETLRTDFIANVSHEMKTPLAVIRNYATLLEGDGVTDEQREEYSRTIRDSAVRLSDMITNILKLNRLENQQIFPTPETYDLSEQLCECVLQYESVWESRSIELVTDIEESITVSSDRELLSLVWNNLLSNAFKFTDDGGRVTVSLTAEDDYATVRIEDTGCGMSAEIGEHMFEKFYQGDSSRATQGNGLGLALVKRVVDITRSEISVESVLGKGSTFTVRVRRSYGPA